MNQLETQNNVQPNTNNNNNNKERRYIRIGINVHICHDGEQPTLWRVNRVHKSVMRPIDEILELAYNKESSHCDRYDLCRFSASCVSLEPGLCQSLHLHLQNLLNAWKDKYPHIYTKINMQYWVCFCVCFCDFFYVYFFVIKFRICVKPKKKKKTKNDKKNKNKNKIK